MSIKSNGILIDSNYYITTWQDEMYNSLWQVLINNGITKSITDKGNKQDQYGEDSNCTYVELFFWSSLIDYFILLKAESLKTGIVTQLEVNDLVEGFNIDCFREIARCKYNKVSIFNSLFDVTAIKYDGLDFMVFDPTVYTTTMFPEGSTVRSPNNLVYPYSDQTALFSTGSTIVISSTTTPENNGTFIVSSSFFQAFVGTVIILTTSPLINIGEAIVISGFSYQPIVTSGNDFIIT